MPHYRPVGVLGLYIQMDSQAIGCADGTWVMCQYGCSTGNDMGAHQHLVTMDAQPENVLMHSD